MNCIALYIFLNVGYNTKLQTLIYMKRLYKYLTTNYKGAPKILILLGYTKHLQGFAIQTRLWFCTFNIGLNSIVGALVVGDISL